MAYHKDYIRIRELFTQQDIIDTFKQFGVLGYELECVINKEKTTYGYGENREFFIYLPRETEIAIR